MTEPHDPHSIDLTATAHAELDAAVVFQHAYWESPEVASMADHVADAIVQRGLAVINARGNKMPQYLSHLFQTEDELGKFAPGSDLPYERFNLLNHSEGARLYHERVREGFLSAMTHTDAVPLERATFPTTVRIGWNDAGEAFIIREELAVDHPGNGDPKDFGEYTVPANFGTWKHPDLIIDRHVIDDNGIDQAQILEAVMRMTSGDKEQRSMFDAARKALKDFRKREKEDPNYSTWGPGSERATHAPLSAAIFDKANLERLDAERAAKPRGLGRLAIKRRKSSPS